LQTNAGPADVLVLDTTRPYMSVKDAVIYVNTAGNATLTVADIDNGSSDNVGIVSKSLSKTAYNCSNVGTSSVTLTATDGSGNASSADANVTVKDTIRPTPVTRNITLTLNSSGTASCTASDINNGSYDNCSVASMSLSKTTFNATNIGNNTVYLTVTDVNGNVNVGPAIVTIVAPQNCSVSITQDVLPGFCQGGAIVLKTSTSGGVTSYLWSTGATSPTINVFASGIYSVTVTAGACTSTASTMVTYNKSSLLSAYTLIATQDNQNMQLGLKHHSEVLSGGVGALGSAGEIQVTEESMVTANTTFARAADFDITGGSIVTNKVQQALSLNLPAWKSNPYYTSTNNKTVASNATVTITDSVMGNVSLGVHSVVTFTRPVIYMKSLSTASQGCTIKFSSPNVEIRVYGAVDLGEDMSFNLDMKQVVIYCGGDYGLKKNSKFVGSVYTPLEIKVEGNINYRDYMYGMYIAKKIESHWTYWNWNSSCCPCSGSNKTDLSPEADEKGLLKDELYMNAFPNPNDGRFDLEVVSEDKGTLQITVFDFTGKMVYNKDLDFTGRTIIPVELMNQTTGYYLVRVELNGATYSKRIMINGSH